MTAFEGLDKARDIAARTPYFPADYQGCVTIREVKQILTRTKTEALVVEFEVVSSNQPDAVRPGERRAWYLDLSDRDMCLPNVKQFAFAALEATTAEARARLTPHLSDIMNEACGEKQTFAGVSIMLNTAWNDRKTFTKHYFAPAVKGAQRAAKK